MNDHPKPQDSQTYGGRIKWVIQCPPIDPRIPLTEENLTKGNVFRRGALFQPFYIREMRYLRSSAKKKRPFSSVFWFHTRIYCIKKS